MYIPILGAIALATGQVLERITLKIKKIDVGLYQFASFLAIVLACIPFLFFFWRMNPEALIPTNIFIFSLVILFSFLANFFMFRSIKHEKLTAITPARVVEPLFTILFALIFSFIFGATIYERNFNIIIPALIASTTLIITHIEKEHFKISKYFAFALIGSLFFALELVISKLILEHFSPITFYFLRCSAILLLSFIIFKPKTDHLGKKPIILIAITGFVWVAYKSIIYFGYTTQGIISTTLLVLLGPILVYIMAWKILKEKMKIKNIIASIIILACVLYVILF